MKLINIGFGSMVAANRLLAIVAPDSAPIKRVIQESRDRGMLIDASYGRKTKSVIIIIAGVKYTKIIIATKRNIINIPPIIPCTKSNMFDMFPPYPALTTSDS